MGNDARLSEFIQVVERLALSAEDKSFLIGVWRQYEAEKAARTAEENEPDPPPEGP